jgi:hypothetical protein
MFWEKQNRDLFSPYGVTHKENREKPLGIKRGYRKSLTAIVLYHPNRLDFRDIGRTEPFVSPKINAKKSQP